MAILRLALQSLRNRKATALLTIFTVAVSVALLIGVERVRTQAKESFANTISGTDLIVGARSGQVNLLLYSVFRIGNATNNIDWKSVEDVKNHPSVAWSIPISLGDSHRGFRVVGTTDDYFKYYRYGQKQLLSFKEGKPFDGLFDTVIGSEVAKKLGYQLGDEIVIAHGLADKSFARHDNLPFKVTGILAPTGTPVDRSVHVSLPAIEAIHIGWESGARMGPGVKPEDIDPDSLQPEQITAVLLGLKSRIQTFALQRTINEYKQEPLTAIMPGIALHELWGMMSVAEQALLVVSGFVVVAGLMGMLSSLLTSLNERRREMAILRGMGARPAHIFFLLISEALFLTLLGIIAGVTVLLIMINLAAPFVLSQYGLQLSAAFLSQHEWMLLGIVLVAGFLVGVLPALRAYRQSLSDGMTIRI
ncbi:outer membrane-specific lipoprotein transporter subunit LolE [Grimontia celer]|uniref:Outer membrane-specific lipoprotein transporter subunit LolE n=1 Tax=Grimontia celer TaxID=1796497 RepID=A0A128F526_9GAMM|nr:ABC transporter permease [Grimontia celer]CZF81396.1 outer membrane-specific lipoprotein transporter subunit LolE [Grimontia celer]